MARIVKAAEVRRNEILETAQHHFYTRGYKNTSIQDIIETIGIAKGTFYHHYDSKQTLLDALTMRNLEQIEQALEPMVNDPNLNALEKLQHFFADTNNMKLKNREYSLTMMRVWYKDENAIMLRKLRMKSRQQFRPLLTKIIRQGITEGSFTTDYPEYTAESIFDITQGLGEPLVGLLVEADDDPTVWEAINQKVAACEQAITRILDAPDGKVKILNVAQYRSRLGTNSNNNKLLL